MGWQYQLPVPSKHKRSTYTEKDIPFWKCACSLYLLKQHLVSVTSALFLLSSAEKRKCLEPVLWRSWTMGWLDPREQITAISLWTSWACEPSFHFSWKPPRRWRKQVLQRRSMKVSHKLEQGNSKQSFFTKSAISYRTCHPVLICYSLVTFWAKQGKPWWDTLLHYFSVIYCQEQVKCYNKQIKVITL